MKILLVDDDPFALKLLSHQMEQLGFVNTISHEHAAGALAELEFGTEAFGLVLCDLQMPGMESELRNSREVMR